MHRLDSVFEEVVANIPSPRRVFLKMDTQGFELEVLKGADQSMRHILGIESEISISPIYESMPTYLQALETYQQYGFTLFGLAENTRNRLTSIPIDYNCLMVRSEQMRYVAHS